MNPSISSTDVLLKLAVSPSLRLFPNSMNILKTPIKNFDNRLRIVARNMKFGSNSNINYVSNVHQPKKVDQDVPSSHLETLDEKPELEIKKSTVNLDTFEQPKKQVVIGDKLESLGEHKKQIEPIGKNDTKDPIIRATNTTYDSLVYILFIGATAGFIMSKYVV